MAKNNFPTGKGKTIESRKLGESVFADNVPNGEPPFMEYTPKGAARAMLRGEILKSADGRFCFFSVPPRLLAWRVRQKNLTSSLFGLLPNKAAQNRLMIFRA